MGVQIYLTFTGQKITRTIPPGIHVNDSPLTEVLPFGCSQNITFEGSNATSKVLLPEEMSGDVRAAAESVGMVEV